MDPRNPHRLNDLRSLAIHRLIAERIEADPGLLEGVRRRLGDLATRGVLHPRYAAAWAELLDGPLDRLLRTLRDDGERATALRQASPFSGIIDQATRWRVWKDVTAAWRADRGAA